jgi:hypothetical protein
VVDESGRPVVGARVWDAWDAPERRETVTNAAGRFQLHGVAEGDLYLFAESPGHALAGGPAHSGRTGVNLVLRPAGAVTMGPPIPPPGVRLDPAQARGAALALLKQAVADSAGASDWAREELLEDYARLDPDAAFAAAGPGDDLRMVYLGAGEGMLAEHFAEAMTLLKKAEPGPERQALLDAAGEYRATNPDLARRCGRAAADALATVRDPEQRVSQAARVISALRGLDDARAAALTQSAYAEAVKLPMMGSMNIYARGQIACVYADTDLDRALALLIPIHPASSGDTSAKAEALKELAVHVARKDLDRGLKLLDGLAKSAPYERDWALADLAVLVAPHDWARAQGLVREMNEPIQRARVAVRLAAVAPPDKAQAAIETAAATLTWQARDGWPDYNPTVAQGMAALAIVARRRGYSGYRELALRAASIAGTSQEDYDTADRQLFEQEQLAQLLAFTAPEVTRLMVQSLLLRSAALPKDDFDISSDLLEIAANVDMQWALQLYQQQRQTPSAAGPPAPAESATTLAEALLQPVAERESHALFMGAWGQAEEGP